MRRLLHRAVYALLMTTLPIIAAHGQLVQPSTPPHITVGGEAEVRVAPDEVVLTLGVQSADPTLAAATSENEARTAAVIEAAQALGVEAAHIQTDHLSVEPRYRNYNETEDLLGYVARTSIVVTLREVDAFEALLTATLEAGANVVHGIQFRTTELRQHRDEARDLALVAAQEKAERMAQTLGQALGPPLSIREDHVGWGSWYNRWWGARAGGRITQNVVQAASDAASADGAVAPGQIAVTARVTVSFALLQ